MLIFFNENCSPIIVSDGVNSETHNMEFVQVTEQEPGKYWFVLRELSASELAWIKMQSDIEYVAMMAGIELVKEDHHGT